MQFQKKEKRQTTVRFDIWPELQNTSTGKGFEKVCF